MKASSVVLLVLVMSFGGLDAAQAQNAMAPAAQPDDWQHLPPATRREMRRQFFNELPATKKQQLRTHVQRFRSLPSPRKRELCRQFEQDRGYLPPACQKLF